MMNQDFGPQYSRDNPYQATQRLQQSRWRCLNTSAGYERYGNYLDKKSAEAGVNFLSPEIFETVKERSNAGKGVDYERVTVNLLTSQALCFNYFVPLVNDLELASRILSVHFPFIKKCLQIEIEYTPPNYLNDQGDNFGVDADIAVRFQHNDSRNGILLVEVKYFENAFSICSHGKYCDYREAPLSKVNDCLYRQRNKYRYWDFTRPEVFDIEKIKSQPSCPYRSSLKQLWTNQILAEAVRENENLTHSHFAVLYPADNIALQTEYPGNDCVFRSYSDLLASPNKFSYITWQSILKTTKNCISSNSQKEWFQRFQKRYRGLY